MTARPDPRIGSELGPYRIESVIGRGGMGVVYLATHAGLNRKVALKLLAPDYAEDEAFRARFLRESRMAAAIDHPNIIPIYEAGEIEGTYFLAMRYVAGTDLEARLRAGPLEPRETVHLLGQVASALDTAHESGLVHRDIKPANVLIASGRGVERGDHAYLTDFGLTKQRGSETGLTQGGAFLGTLDYIAPEQIEGKPVDGRADQYGLACVAFHCLTGRVPFERDADIAIAMAHLRDATPSAVALRPDLPHGVDAVLARGMAKRPDDRYPSCETFASALREALGVHLTQQGPAVGAVQGRARGRVVSISLVAIGIAAVAGAAAILGSSRPGTGVTTASPSASTGVGAAAATPALAPSASATRGIFPDAAEAALMKSLPRDLADTCQRGSYAPLMSGFGSGHPLASLACTPVAGSGASSLLVWRFPNFGTAVGNSGFTTDSYFESLGEQFGTKSGDCARTWRVNGRWMRGDAETGAIICYTDPVSGDAHIWWSYKEASVLVKAINQRGDRTALYEFFEARARFIAP